MVLEILHAADLHLDSPFAALPPEQAARRRQRQRELPGAIVDLSNRLGCQLLLLAGDVFDGERVCPETIQTLQAALARCRAAVFIAPGNHDPYHAQSPWARSRWPENVHIFTGPMDCVALPELGCRVWGAAFTGGEARDLLTPVPSGDLLEIGVLHGDPVQTAGPYNAVSPAQLEACGLDYLALGHIHRPAPLRRAGRTWYAWPGVAMGRGFDETGVHGVYHVSLDRRDCRLETLPLAGPRYECLTVQVEDDAAASVLAALPADSRELFCRVTLTGESEPPDLEALTEKLAPHFAALELRDGTVPPQDLWDGWEAETLRGLTLRTLKTQYDAAADQETRRTLALAARYALAALEGRDAP